MKLNGITCTGYAPKANEAAFELEGTTVETVSALDGKTLTVTDDEGATIETFAGYVIASIQVKGEGIRLRVVRKLDDQTAEAIEGLDANVAILQAQAAALGAQVEQASASANPQVVNLAKMQVAAMTFASETEIASVSTLLPEWVPDGHEYKQGDALAYEGKTWRVSQDTTSQSIYPPGVSESLYYEIQIAADGIIVYRPAHGQYDSVRLGELRHYPDAESPVYRSKVDYNAYSPDTVPNNWELVE